MSVHIFAQIARVYRHRGLSGVLRGFVIETMNPTLGRILAQVHYKQTTFLICIGYWPKLKNPRTFNEKVEHHRLFNIHRLAPLVSDKWRVREYVAERGLAHILNEVYYATDKPETIPFDTLPSEFVVKSNYGCGGEHMLIVRNKEDIKREDIIRISKTWLSPEARKRRCYGEPRLVSLHPLILVEGFLKDGKYGIPLDYKFFVFHGRVQFVEVFDKNQPTETWCTIYDRAWRPVNFTRAYRRGKEISKPANLDELVSIAERLGSEFEFCRVDLYNLNDKEIIFGELTLYPGMAPFHPRIFDDYFGSLW